MSETKCEIEMEGEVVGVVEVIVAAPAAVVSPQHHPGKVGGLLLLVLVGTIGVAEALMVVAAILAVIGEERGLCIDSKKTQARRDICFCTSMLRWAVVWAGQLIDVLGVLVYYCSYCPELGLLLGMVYSLFLWGKYDSVTMAFFLCLLKGPFFRYHG